MEVHVKVLVLNGPNLNALGTREPDVYGKLTLAQITQRLEERAARLGCELMFFQSNSEGALIDTLYEHAEQVQGVIINPGALTHYGLSLHDAFRSVKLPVIEVHLSNTQARGGFRERSVIAPVAVGTISGFGWRSYVLALDALVEILRETWTFTPTI